MHSLYNRPVFRPHYYWSYVSGCWKLREWYHWPAWPMELRREPAQA